jgi:hypothetical protein
VQIIALGVPGHTFAGWVSTDDGGYSGSNDPADVIMIGPISEFANFNSPPPVSVTVTSDPAGDGYVMVDNTTLSTPVTMVWGEGEVHSVSASSSNNGYAFVRWSDGGAQSHTITVPSANSTYTAYFGVSVQITVTSNQTGAGYVAVDGAPIATPQTFTWLSNSLHNLTAAGTVTGGTGTRYVYQSWSDSGAQSHTVTVPSSATTYTASYQTQYYLTVQAGVGGTVSPSSAWEDAGASVQIQAYPDGEHAFSSWSGSGEGSYGGTVNPRYITMSGPVTESATFGQTVQVAVTSSPTGSGYVAADGTNIATPQTLTWVVGSNHTVTAYSPISCGTGCQYTFVSWSDSGAQSHNITVSTLTTITATFQEQYYLTMSAGGGGSVDPPSGWYDAGANVQISAAPGGGYTFSGWTGSGTGSYTGTATPTTITVNLPVGEAAAFTQTQTGSTAGIAAATGVGATTFHVPSGTLSGLTAISEASLPTSGKPDLQFPYGFFRFNITGLTPGATVTVTITLPTTLQPGAQYWKYESGAGWVDMTSHMGGNNGGSTITLTLTDGGAGDQDGVANGVIADDGGPGIPPPATPTGNNGNGTVIVTGAPPTITSIQIDPGDGSNASAINVDTYYLVKVAISDPSQLTSLQRLELRLYQNGTTWPGNMDPERRQGFAWEYNGTWYQVGGSGWTSPDGVYFNATGSSHTNLSNTQGTFTFKVKAPKVSHYTAANGWYVQAWVEDKSSNQNMRTNLFAVNLYVHLTVPTTITWSATAGSSDVEASGMPFAIAYQSNAVVKLQLNATDPASQYGDTFAATNLRISDTTNPNGPHSQALSASLTDWKTGLEVTDTGGMDAYWFVSVPSGQPTGTYTFTYTMSIAFQDYAT